VDVVYLVTEEDDDLELEEPLFVPLPPVVVKPPPVEVGRTVTVEEDDLVQLVHFFVHVELVVDEIKDVGDVVVIPPIGVVAEVAVVLELPCG